MIVAHIFSIVLGGQPFASSLYAKMLLNTSYYLQEDH